MSHNNDLLEMIGLGWSFSSNSALFAQLASQPDPRDRLPSSLHALRPEVVEPLHEIGEKLEALLAGEIPDFSSLPNTMLSHCELVFAAIACQVGECDEKITSAVADSARDGLHRQPDDDYSEELMHAYRELAHLMSIYYQRANDKDGERALLRMRQQITCAEMDYRPDLVGASFVQYGDVIEEKTYESHSGSLWHYWAVADMFPYLVPEIDSDRYPRPETHTALTWLLAAWERLALPENQTEEPPPQVLAESDDYGRHARELRQALADRGVDELFVLPRCGAVGHFYFDEVHFAARVIRDYMTLEGPNRDLKKRIINHRFALPMGQLDQFEYAIERYQAKQILQGVKVQYGEDLTLPFAALEILDA